MNWQRIITGQAILLISMLSFAQPQTSRAESVAMITDLQGQANLRQELKVISAEILKSLYVGNQLNLEKNTLLSLVYYSNGREYVFNGPATIEISDKHPNVLTGQAASTRDLKLIREIQLQSDEGYLNQAALRLRGYPGNRRKLNFLVL